MRPGVLLLSVLCLLATACTTAARPTQEELPGAADMARPAAVELLRLAGNDVGPLTPFRVSTAGPSGAVLLTLVFDTLTWKDEHGIIPWLATGWEISPDGREYTFTLASDVKWHDGQALSAEDVAFSFQYYVDHPYRWMSTAMVERATALGRDRVRVQLRQPYAPFLEDVAGTVPIIPRHVWSGVADPERYDGADATVGSGPFQLAEYRPAEGAYRLVANAGYFHGDVRVRELQHVSSSPETQVQALQQGQLDMVWTTDASTLSLFKDNPRISAFETPPLSIVRLAINTERAPLDRLEVRQAIAYALDRARIAEVVTKGKPVVGSAGVIPPETPWYNPTLRTYPFDAERARSLLAGQGYTLELLADPTNREPELLQPMLQAVGINLVVKRVDGKTRTQLLREKNFQLAMVQHIGVGGDPDFLRRWYAGEEANDFAQGSIFHDPEYEQLGREQATSIDPRARQAPIFRMQEILAEQLPTIVLYYRRFYWLHDSSRYAPANTWGGLINGVPFVYNKLTFLRW